MNKQLTIDEILQIKSDAKKVNIVKDKINTNSYIDLQRKLLHMDYNSEKINLIDALQYEEKLVEFKKDIDCKCENNEMIRKVLERSTNTPEKLYLFVIVDSMYKNTNNIN